MKCIKYVVGRLVYQYSASFCLKPYKKNVKNRPKYKHILAKVYIYFKECIYQKQQRLRFSLFLQYFNKLNHIGQFFFTGTMSHTFISIEFQILESQLLVQFTGLFTIIVINHRINGTMSLENWGIKIDSWVLLYRSVISFLTGQNPDKATQPPILVSKELMLPMKWQLLEKTLQ